jgi:hypothetical protein
MNNKTVKEFLDMTDFSDIDEVEIFDIEEGTDYDYDVIDGEVSKWCVYDFGNVKVTDFRIYGYEGRNILIIYIYGK